MRILVVEDDELLRNGLEVGLSINGFTVESVRTCVDAEAALMEYDFEAVIFDLMLPDGLGSTLLRRVRAQDKSMPVLMLSARNTVTDRITCLDLGADDYVGKPFDLGELSARLRAIIRRRQADGSRPFAWKDLLIDPSTLNATRGDKCVRLSRREFGVLSALIRQPGMIVSKAQLEEGLYGWQENIESNAIEVHVHHIRAKLGSDLVETVRGLGYRLAGGRS